MKILLIDAGNSTVDFRSYDSETKKLEKIYRPWTKTLTDWNPKDIQKKLKWKYFNFEMIVFASVVPQFNRWMQQFKQLVKVPMVNIQDAKKLQNSGFKKVARKEVGADLLANFHAQNWDDALIISLGTATTIAQIEKGVFQGVIIVPGIRTSLESLVSSAALLKNKKFSWVDQPIGTSTIDAIGLGAINGHYYLIKSFIEKLKTSKSTIIFTGGNADLIIPGIEKDHFLYDEALIFKGLINLI